MVAVGTVAIVVGGFVALAVQDARSQEVSVRAAQLVTAIAVTGLSAATILGDSWTRPVFAVAGAVLVTGLQALPIAIARLRSSPRSAPEHAAPVGAADIRLAVPLGWTLGWFGLAFAVVGYGLALVAGLATAVVTGRERIAFVPFLTAGLVVGLGWALARQLAGGG